MTTQDLNEIKEMLRGRHSYVGECDRCHAESRKLWIDEQEPGEFAFCKDCWRRYLARHTAKRGRS